MIIFSSDNGPVLQDGYYDEAVKKVGDHSPTGGRRGGKYSLFDGGTHIPFSYTGKDISPRSTPTNSYARWTSSPLSPKW